MSESPASRLRASREKAGFRSAQEAAENFGWGVSGFRHHENGTRGFDHLTAVKYARAFNVSAQWLLGLTSNETPQSSTAAISVRQIPLVGRAPAGNWREAIEVPIGYVWARVDRTGPNAFAVEIDGDSMNLILPDGGWAVIDPDQRSFFDKKVYLVMNGDAEATLKRYVSNPARLVPVSTNDTHGDILLTGDPITIIGRVVSYGNDEGL